MKRHLADEGATAALGAALARALKARPGAVVYLHGDLGAGKTTLARGLLRELGVQGHVRSPTYTLMEPYRLPGHEVLHLDLYRLQDPREVLNLGLDDYPPASTLWLVEWPEKAAGLLPSPQVSIRLAHAADGRQAEWTWPVEWGAPPEIGL